MVTVKTLKEMYRKYELKYSGANVSAALTAVKPIMEASFQGASSVIFDAVERTRVLLNQLGIPSTQWGKYISFAEKLMKKTFSFSGATLALEASALKQEWITAHGADSAILDQIINLILGTTPPY